MYCCITGQNDATSTDKLPPDEVYPVMAKPSPSLQIIATRNRPCCECIRYNQRAPLCLLFLIFIVVSCSLITGVMFYLKSGNLIHKYTILLWCGESFGISHGINKNSIHFYVLQWLVLLF